MDKYLNSFRDMISLRGLTDHTLKNYCTYIRSYLDYLSCFLHKTPEEVPWDEMRDYIRWLQKFWDLSDRTIDTFFLSRHTHDHEGGVDLLTIKALLGHKSFNSTTIYVHLAAGGISSAVSPFDHIAGVSHG